MVIVRNAKIVFVKCLGPYIGTLIPGYPGGFRK